MGQFSWIYSDTNKQIINDKRADTYLLVPDPFQKKYGEYIYESCYEGYGKFGNHDVYDLILEWNRGMIPEILRRIRNGTWRGITSEKECTDLQRYHEGKEVTCDLRRLGIAIACHDENNFVLEYPIKITSKPMPYKAAKPSRTDLDQGWKM
ncbi:MAG: hypothetical protein NC293_13580 [Roseburia sp.]|nr:hypothetical protein [Roseburia sp.]